MTEKTWKAVERRVASLFGTRRTPLSGGNDSRTRSDTLHPKFFIETKHRKKHTAVSLWYEVAELAAKEKKTPVVVLAERSRKRLFAVVPLELASLQALVNELVSVSNAALGVELPRGESVEVI